MKYMGLFVAKNHSLFMDKLSVLEYFCGYTKNLLLG